MGTSRARISLRSFGLGRPRVTRRSRSAASTTRARHGATPASPRSRRPTSIDDRGRVRITDFGLAGLEEDQRPGGGGLRLQAPEQSAGGVDGSSDIYSLGLVLYEVFRQRAYESRGTPAQDSSPRSPSTITPDIDPRSSVSSRCPGRSLEPPHVGVRPRRASGRRSARRRAGRRGDAVSRARGERGRRKESHTREWPRA
jgi:hypothetical protein